MLSAAAWCFSSGLAGFVTLILERLAVWVRIIRASRDGDLFGVQTTSGDLNHRNLWQYDGRRQREAVGSLL